MIDLTDHIVLRNLLRPMLNRADGPDILAKGLIETLANLMMEEGMETYEAFGFFSQLEEALDEEIYRRFK